MNLMPGIAPAIRKARRLRLFSTDSTESPTVSSSISSNGVASHGTPSNVSMANDVRLGRSVSIDQAAQLLRMSRRTIYYRIRDGRLQTIRSIGGSQRVLVESLYASGFKPQPFSASASAATFALRSLRS